MEILVTPSGKYLDFSYIKKKFYNEGIRVEYRGRNLFRFTDEKYYTFFEIFSLEHIDSIVGYISKTLDNAPNCEKYLNNLPIKELKERDN